MDNIDFIVICLLGKKYTQATSRRFRDRQEANHYAKALAEDRKAVSVPVPKAIDTEYYYRQGYLNETPEERKLKDSK